MGSFLDKPQLAKDTVLDVSRKEEFIACTSAMQGWRIDMEVWPLYSLCYTFVICLARTPQAAALFSSYVVFRLACLSFLVCSPSPASSSTFRDLHVFSHVQV